MLSEGGRVKRLDIPEGVINRLQNFEIGAHMYLHLLVMHLRKVRLEVHLVQDQGQRLYQHEMDFPVVDGVTVHNSVVEGLLAQ